MSRLSGKPESFIAPSPPATLADVRYQSWRRAANVHNNQRFAQRSSRSSEEAREGAAHAAGGGVMKDR